MKNLFGIILLLFCNLLFAQDYIGVREMNYSGITGVDLQPASIVDSRYKFDLTLGGFSMAAYNNYLSLKGIAAQKLGTVTENEIWDKYVYERTSRSNKQIYQFSELQLPAFMVTLSDKTAIGFNWKIRQFFNIDDIGADLAKLIKEELEYPSLWVDRLYNKRLSIQTMAWAEYGFNYGRVLLDNNEHFLKIGGRLKLLQGLGAAFMYIDNLEYEFLNADTLSIFSSDVNYGHSDNFEFDINTIKYRFKSNPGIGFDFGIVYEWRKDYKKYQYEMDGQQNLWRKDQNKYKLKVGFSALDIGGMKYRKGTYSNDFRADIRDWNISVLDFQSVQQFNDTINARFQKLPSDKREFYMNLPTSLSLQIDYNIWKDLYIGATSFYALKFKNDRNKVHHISYYSLIPRWDHKFLGVALPLTWSPVTGLRYGPALRIGYLMVGTSDIKPVLKGEKYGADVFVALKIPILYHHPKDKDGDLVSDKLDLCPDVKGVWTFKGCPDMDGDNIEDKYDECPAEAGLVEFNGCPDTDRDGIPDKKDDCPTEPGLKEFNGCPDTDSDGIKDSDDQCPKQPGLKEFNGCPDTDKDGIADKDDNCPLEPGIPENFGCPDYTKLYLVDANGDIIATAKMEGDKYVFENLPLNQSYLFLLDVKDNIYPEKMDIYVRNNNKEEKITAKLNANGYYEFRYLKQQEVVLKEKENKDLQVVILQKEEEEVLKKAFDNLEFETGKAIIRNVSYASLEELAELMIKKDKWKIKISGHTDNVGNPASNLQLSKKRAEAVKAFLMSRGVTEDRIFVLYFGQTKPIADNKTEEGRQKNRRVEMQILE